MAGLDQTASSPSRHRAALTRVSATEVAIALDVVDWRRQVFALYRSVRERAITDPHAAHTLWRRKRDELFVTHPSSPLMAVDRPGFRGLPVADYDPAWRIESSIRAGAVIRRLDVPTGTDGVVPFELLGTVEVEVSGTLLGSLDVWRIAAYGGGLFIPVKDASAGTAGGTYGGGRYLVDTIKGADLGRGEMPGSIVLDFNFAYNPSCAYDPEWACPLAPPGNILGTAVPTGEMYGSADI